MADRRFKRSEEPEIIFFCFRLSAPDVGFFCTCGAFMDAGYISLRLEAVSL